MNIMRLRTNPQIWWGLLQSSEVEPPCDLEAMFVVRRLGQQKVLHFSHQLGHVHLMGYTRKTEKWAGMFVNIPENGLECSAKNGLCSCIPKFETRGTTFSGHFVVFNTAVRGYPIWTHLPSGKQTWFAGKSPFGWWFSHSKYSNAHLYGISHCHVLGLIWHCQPNGFANSYNFLERKLW